MAGAVRFTTDGADRDREPHRRLRRAGARHRAGGVRRARRRHRRRGAGAGRARRRAGRARLRGGPRRSSPPSRATRGPCSTTARAFEIRGGRHPGGRAGAEGRQGRRLHRERLRAGCRARPTLPAGFDEVTEARIWLRHRPQHGRQVDLPAPERAHHRAGADGLVRAGALRPHRHRRPAVLARRRRRRPRARALDLHGRDGGDRRHPQPGHRALARHPRRDRPRHRHLRRPVDRLGGGGVPARGQPAAARCLPRTTTS